MPNERAGGPKSKWSEGLFMVSVASIFFFSGCAQKHEQAPPPQAVPPASAEKKAEAPEVPATAAEQAEPLRDLSGPSDDSVMPESRPGGASSAPKRKASGARNSASEGQARGRAADELADHGEQLRQESQDFERDTALEERDCGRAKGHRDSICQIATKICRIVENEPNQVAEANYCVDAQRRCTQARSRYSDTCRE